MFKNRPPLQITVDESKWYAFGNTNSFYHNFLYWYLKLRGGISNTVAPGNYVYFIERRGILLYTTLDYA